MPETLYSETRLLEARMEVCLEDEMIPSSPKRHFSFFFVVLNSFVCSVGRIETRADLH